MSDQIEKLHQSTQLSEIEHRLRWITCAQIEKTFEGIFPHFQVFPFGSSVNGFGNNSSDLDMVASLNETNKSALTTPLMFHAKYRIPEMKTQVQRHLGLFSDILQSFVPGCTKVENFTTREIFVFLITFFIDFKNIASSSANHQVLS